MEIEWYAEDNSITIGHASKLTLGGKKTISPQHALTTRDCELVGADTAFSQNMVICAENLTYQTFQEIGKDAVTTNALIDRMNGKKQPGKINLVYSRIPASFNFGDKSKLTETVDQFQASGLVNTQIEAGADALIPPLPAGIRQKEVFDVVMERTVTENQTASKERPIIGYVPTTAEMPLVREMLKEYIKRDTRFFTIDFSGSPLNRALIRLAVSTIREMLKIKRGKTTKPDQQYYLHLFNVSASKKSPASVTPITDLLSHAYGVDSTSGVIWGGGNLVKDKLRWYNTKDYGAYQLNALDGAGITVPNNVTSGTALDVYKKLRRERLKAYGKETANIVEKIPEGEKPHGYGAYLAQKERTTSLVKALFTDIKEIQAYA